MKAIIIGLTCVLLAPAALAEPPKDDAGRTLCRAYAQVLKADLAGQDMMIKSLEGNPVESAKPHFAKKKETFEADTKLFNAMLPLYADAPTPSPEMMADLRNNTPMSQIRSGARGCL